MVLDLFCTPNQGMVEEQNLAHGFIAFPGSATLANNAAPLAKHRPAAVLEQCCACKSLPTSFWQVRLCHSLP